MISRINPTTRDAPVAMLKKTVERPIRRSCSVGSGPSAEPANSSDYAGAPDVEGDENKEVAVGAGKDAEIVVSFSGESTTKSSDDKDSLQKAAGKGNGGAPSSGGGATKGGVTLTIKVAS